MLAVLAVSRVCVVSSTYTIGGDCWARTSLALVDGERSCAGLADGRSYLVDPASSHMLVSKIKPCMSKYKLLHSETANGSLNQLWFLRSYKLLG